jgi:DNA-binding MarR family transcriptional regulator
MQFSSIVELLCYSGRVPDDAPALEAVRTLARASRVLESATRELSLAHYRVLSAIAGGDERASRVATRLALGRPTISASVDALCRRGLVERDEVSDDQRAVALRLTPAGQRLLAEVEAVMLARFRAVLAHVADEAQVTAALQDLGAGLDRVADERLAARRAEVR